MANSFGNFVNRVLSFVSKNYSGVLPDGGDQEGPLSPNDLLDANFIAEVNSLLAQYIDALEAVKIRHGLHVAMQISSRGNQYLQDSGLNNTLKESDPKRCAQVLVRAVNLIYVLSVVVEPYMPSTAASILEQLNAPQRTVPEVFSIDILPGHTLGKPAHLFKPIKEETAEALRAKFAGTKKDVVPADASVDHPTPALSKRKGAAAAKAPKETMYSGPKAPEIEALEEKIAKRGDEVRGLKAQAKELEKTTASAVEELLKLKAELAEAIKKVASN